MSDYWWAMIGLAAGVPIGAFYFAGLWWTVRRLATAQHPAALMMGSMLARNAVALAGMYLASGRTWQGLLGGLVGVLLARGFILHHMREATAREASEKARGASQRRKEADLEADT